MSWEVQLGDTSARAAWIVVERRAGDCAGPAQDQRVVARADAMSLAAMSVALAPGPQAFAALVVDSECRVIGSGCTDLVLDAATPTIAVRVVAAVTPVACGADCPVADCAAGRPDAGTVDAPGLDALGSGSDVGARTDAPVGDAFGADASPLACRAEAMTAEACAACEGLWCEVVLACCPPTFECCAEGCRRVCDGMVPP